jgi:hypothetical protein
MPKGAVQFLGARTWAEHWIAWSRVLVEELERAAIGSLGATLLSCKSLTTTFCSTQIRSLKGNPDELKERTCFPANHLPCHTI